MSRAQGESVTLTYQGTGGAPMVVRNANGGVRVLQAYERLILDTLQCNFVNTVSADGDDMGPIQVAPGNSDSETPPSMIIASFLGCWTPDPGTGTGFSGGSERTEFPHEGLSLPVGVLPWSFNLGTGDIYTLVGTGRIIVDSTQVGRQNWREKLNP